MQYPGPSRIDLPHADTLEIAKTLITASRSEKAIHRDLTRRGIPADSIPDLLATARQQIDAFSQRETGRTLIRLAQTRIAQGRSKQQIIEVLISAGMPAQSAYQTYHLADATLDSFWPTPEARPLIAEVSARHTRRMQRGLYILGFGVISLIVGVMFDGTNILLLVFIIALFVGGIEFLAGRRARTRLHALANDPSPTDTNRT